MQRAETLEVMSKKAQDAPAIVPVLLGGRSYDILIGGGLIEAAGRLITERLPGAKVAVVTDQNVAKLHLSRLQAPLEAPGIFRGSVVLPAGEKTKSFAELGPLCEELIKLGVERNDVVVAFGGGVIGDLAAFAASILRRGVRMVQIPTTLLAQVDSSVGGKTGINTPQGKNLIGTFHQPSLVLADIDVLKTLPKRELRAGYAEVVKYGLLGDSAFHAWLDQNADKVLSLDQAALSNAIEVCCQMKAAIVARDETETGDRMLLNLGHTFGHALEAFAGFDGTLLHGEAVAIGMVMAFRFSETRRLVRQGTSELVRAHLASAGLPTSIHDIPFKTKPDAATLRKLMGQDKKVKQGAVTLILVRDIGEAFASRDAAWPEIEAFLETQLGS